MRRLEIVLAGCSGVLEALHRELLEHGHAVHHLRDLHAVYTAAVNEPALLIDDGSLALDETCLGAFAAEHCLSVRVGFKTDALQDLPALELLCWHGRRLIVRQWQPEQAAGNGRQLRDDTVATLVDLLALQVSRLSRDADYLAGLSEVAATPIEPVEGLQALDCLVFEHRLNQTAHPALLEVAATPLSIRLAHSLAVFAERPALTLGGQTLSYRQLQAQAVAIQQPLLDRLATLRQGQAVPVVGICLPKSAALFAGVLAILGSGAIYLPLDPNQPLQRQQYILENAGAVLLLHDGEHSLAASGFPALAITDIAVTACDQPLVRVAFASDSPCMALYTSGTTGQPKGCCSASTTSATSRPGMPTMWRCPSTAGSCSSRP